MDLGTALFTTARNQLLDLFDTFTGRLPHDLEHLAGDIALLVLLE